MLLIEIIAVAAAIVFLIGAGITAGRKALRLLKTVKSVRAGIQSRVFHLMEEAHGAQTRAQGLPPKANFLEWRAAVLLARLDKLRLLDTAAMEARRRLDPVLDYLGL